MKAILLALALGTTSLFAGCATSPTEVEMKGGSTELAQLAGEWEGSYNGIDSGRTGPVSFSLQLGRHTADGTVLMGGATPLKIQFVAVDKGRISGKIDPYTDPQCSCEVVTEFSGTVSSGVITGSFTTKVAGQDFEQRGEWSVTRKSS